MAKKLLVPVDGDDSQQPAGYDEARHDQSNLTLFADLIHVLPDLVVNSTTCRTRRRRLTFWSREVAPLGAARSEPTNLRRCRRACRPQRQKKQLRRTKEMAEEKNPGSESEFDALPDSELDEIVGGAHVNVSQLLRNKLSNDLFLKSLKPISPSDFGKVTASLCLYDPPR